MFLWLSHTIISLMLLFVNAQINPMLFQNCLVDGRIFAETSIIDSKFKYNATKLSSFTFSANFHHIQAVHALITRYHSVTYLYNFLKSRVLFLFNYQKNEHNKHHFYNSFATVLFPHLALKSSR